jgi:ribosomal-protein-alanine N-acetyltransferase
MNHAPGGKCLVHTMRVLQTERLRLVPVALENADVLWRVLQQPGLREFQDLPDVDLVQFRRMVASRPTAMGDGSWGRFEWLIYLAGVEEAVGWASLRVGERIASAAEIGYSVLEGYRGRGVATECVLAIVEEAFTRMHLQRIRAYCVPQNHASRSVLRRAGFREDGVLPRGATVQGRPVDVIGYIVDAGQRTRTPASCVPKYRVP